MPGPAAAVKAAVATDLHAPRSTFAGEAPSLCESICGPAAPVPAVKLEPGWRTARGFLGEYAAGSEYRPARGGSPAAIMLHRSLLADRGLLRAALVHELLHHWEHLLDGAGRRPAGYAPAVEALVLRLLPDLVRQRRWRERHSTLYVAKALAGCDQLRVPLEALLFPAPRRG
jgi:hypothetical protein